MAIWIAIALSSGSDVNCLVNKRKNDDLGLEKSYHQWVYSSDDILNKILKFCVFCLYGYGIYIFILEIWSKFFWINYD